MSNCDDKDENQMEVDIEDKAQVLDQKEAVVVDDDEEDKGNDSSSDIEIEGAGKILHQYVNLLRYYNNGPNFQEQQTIFSDGIRFSIILVFYIE